MDFEKSMKYLIITFIVLFPFALIYKFFGGKGLSIVITSIFLISYISALYMKIESAIDGLKLIVLFLSVVFLSGLMYEISPFVGGISFLIGSYYFAKYFGYLMNKYYSD